MYVSTCNIIRRFIRRDSVWLRVYSLRHLSSETVISSVSVTVKTEPTEDELENEEPWMQEEIKEYYRGKNFLAKIMGKDPNTFTDKDIEESIQYLLPSSLTAKDARPFLKHPSMIYPKRLESAFDEDGRPLESNFYTGSPMYHNLIHEMYKQERKLDASSSTHSHASPLQDNGVPTTKWLSKEKLSDKLAEELNDKQYENIIERLTSLSNHPLSHLIEEFLDNYRLPILNYRTQAKLPVLNEKGYSYAVGRRKTATACVWMKLGSGNITVNNTDFRQYFPRIDVRQQVLYPFILTNQLGHYDVSANIKGGGITGQAGSLRLGISKAMLAFPGDHSDILESAGLLIRDPRMVERKKPGQKKARKKFAWVKR